MSLPEEDVAFLDAYARDKRIASRSAVVHRAVELLRAAELGAAYEGAWNEWETDAANLAWDESTGDGLV